MAGIGVKVGEGIRGVKGGTLSNRSHEHKGMQEGYGTVVDGVR